MSDGELDEGSVWEAADFACKYNLQNLTVIIDYNRLKSFSGSQSIRIIQDKWQAFGWQTIRVDGHNLDTLKNTLLRNAYTLDLPTCVIAQTVKGKGVKFMENKLEWHYKYPDKEELKLALEGLE